MALMTYAGISAQQRNFYSMVLLKRALPSVPMLGEGRKDSIARRQGKTIEWRYLDSFPRATTPLTEGTPPSETAMVWSKSTATVQQFGAWTKLSDLLVHQGIDPVWTEASEAFGEQAGQTLHTVLVNILAAGTNVRYADAVANRVSVATANVLDVAEIRRARRILAGANVRPYSDGYHSLVHPYSMELLTSDATIMSVAQYGAAGSSKREGVDLLDGVVMRFGGFKFIESTDAPVFAGAGAAGIDVYGSLFYGPDWFGEVDLAAAPTGVTNADTNKVSGLRIMGVPIDEPSRSDPLAQYGTIGWKAWYTALILQQFRGVRVEHAA